VCHAHSRTISGKRADDRHQGDHAGVGEQFRNLADTTHVLAAVGVAETQVGIQPVPQIVGIEHVREHVGGQQLTGHTASNRRLARTRQPRQPHGCPAQPMVGPALIAWHRGLVPHGLIRLCHVRGDSSMPAAQVCPLCSSTRMNDPVVRFTW